MLSLTFSFTLVSLAITILVMLRRIEAFGRLQVVKRARLRQWRTSAPLQSISGLYLSTTASNFYEKGMITGSSKDTIYALSSGPMTKTGVAVIRLSGEAAGEALKILQTVPEKMVNVGYRQAVYPKSRTACVRYLFDPLSGDMLDQALVLWLCYLAPQSLLSDLLRHFVLLE